jgi:hypothetical protein
VLKLKERYIFVVFDEMALAAAMVVVRRMSKMTRTDRGRVTALIDVGLGMTYYCSFLDEITQENQPR